METLWSIRRPVSELRPGDHAWLAYECREEQDCVIDAFTRAGPAAGDKIIHVPGGAADPGADLDPGLLLATLKDEIAQAMREGHRGVRIAADLTWALSRPGGLEPLTAFELALEVVIGVATRATAVCQFDRQRCTSAQLEALSAAHGLAVVADPVFADDVLRIARTFRPAGLAFTGELDASRHPVLVRALAAARADAGDRELHLDMSGLGFIDLGALNILAGTAEHRAEGRPIVLDRMPPQLRAVLDTVGWHMLPGLQLGTC